MVIKRTARTSKRLLASTLLVTGLAVAMTACSGPSPRHQDRSSANANHSAVIAKARSLLGTRYRYGGNRPETGFDCSGFVQYTHASAGIRLPRSTSLQHRATRFIKKRNLKPGDLVFFRIDQKHKVSHVGIYLGNGKFIHAPSSGKQVSIARLDNPYWVKHYDSARRVY